MFTMLTPYMPLQNRTRFIIRLTTGHALKLSILATLLLATTIHCFAEDRPFNRIDQELDLQKKIRQQEQIKQELEKNRRGYLLQQPAPAESASLTDSGPKFPIKKITIDNGDQEKLAVDISDITAHYENRELGNSELFALIRDITNRYAEHGYATTTISLIPKNLKDGLVELVVNWGKVEGWLINGKPPATLQEQWMTSFAMPGVIDKPLNIQQVDQMVENLNTAAKTTRVDIQPSPRVGYSYLNLVIEEKKEPALTLRANNSGTGGPNDGRYRFTASTSISDLLLGNDTLGLNLNSRRYKMDDSNSEYSGGISYSVPFGYSKVDLRLNHSQYEKLSTGKYGDYNTSGNSQVYAAKFSQVLMREKTQKLTTSVELEHKENSNFVENSLTAINSIPYTKIAFGLEHVTQLLGGSLYSDITLSKGLSILDSEKAAYDSSGDKKHFKKMEFNTAWSRPFTLASKDFNFSSRIGGQYSTDNLLSSEKLGLGDEFTVRGFKGPSLWGDQAIYLSNTVTMPLQLLGGTISPLIGLDTGYAHDVAPNKDHGSITGLALGTSANWRYGGGSITLGVPLSMSDALKDISDGTVIYLSTYLTL